jgi:hypothetical protein
MQQGDDDLGDRENARRNPSWQCGSFAGGSLSEGGTRFNAENIEGITQSEELPVSIRHRNQIFRRDGQI